MGFDGFKEMIALSFTTTPSNWKVPVLFQIKYMKDLPGRKDILIQE